MNANRTERDVARSELTKKIKAEARAQLAIHGAHGLSLRAVARSLGVASSALYRYFPSRDDLLTALIIDAYNDLGAAVEKADKGGTPAERWLTTWRTVRHWAINHRHQYALIYGSPIPGYRAPETTIQPATRVPFHLVSIAADAKAPDGELPPVLHGQATNIVDSISIDLPPGALARVMVAWTQLFGSISFELFGQLVGSADPADEFFDFAATAMAEYVGL